MNSLLIIWHDHLKFPLKVNLRRWFSLLYHRQAKHLLPPLHCLELFLLRKRLTQRPTLFLAQPFLSKGSYMHDNYDTSVLVLWSLPRPPHSTAPTITKHSSFCSSSRIFISFMIALWRRRQCKVWIVNELVPGLNIRPGTVLKCYDPLHCISLQGLCSLSLEAKQGKNNFYLICLPVYSWKRYPHYA